MDSLWFLVACVGFFWLVLWSLRDFDKPSDWFWPFDARWMKPPPRPPAERTWKRAIPGRKRERP